MSAVSNAAPPSRVKVVPDASEADGDPLTQERVRVTQLLQTDRNQVPLQTRLLQDTRGITTHYTHAQNIQSSPADTPPTGHRNRKCLKKEKRHKGERIRQIGT